MEVVIEDVNFGKAAKVLEGPAYIAVGFGVLGFQRAQVRRRELQRRLGQLAITVNHKMGEISDGVAARLPTEASDLLKAAGDFAGDLPREAEGLVEEAVALGRLVLRMLQGGNGR